MLMSSLIGVRGSGRSTLLELVSGGRTFAAERTGSICGTGGDGQPTGWEVGAAGRDVFVPDG